MPLTDIKIRNTKPSTKPLKLTDGGGLYLEIRPSGAKLWRYRYRIAGKENLFAIGKYSQAVSGETEDEAMLRRHSGLFTLAEARQERERCRGLVKQGTHPSHDRQAQQAAVTADNANTLEAVAKEWIEQKQANWSPYYLRQVENFMGADVFPQIGSLPIRSVNSAHLLQILKQVESRGAETVAMLLRQWCSAIFRYAVATLRADSDPAAALKGAIHRPKVQHKKPLDREQIIQFIEALESYGGYRITVIALRLLLLTFVRTVELRAARWDEFELDSAQWKIPAERMKMREVHIVPLSTQAVELLRELHTLTGGQRWLFPNNRRPSDCMTNTTLNRALERMGFNGKGSIGFSAHGFRATASTILNEAGYRPDVIERQLAHKERNRVRASYNQAEYLQERQAMMQQWADMLDNLMI
ncbi:tyrosine-type recombinase/integrase [Dongshaea marina]|uniref:tyrosine-type recombinase/integrase n=1 Tax=Dongshaea marina TaxID=2047966 RepID=UPI000D3E95F9|nr:integrase arm-type DNA-binding domain-containing protein [Dongshaea marina]